MAPVITICVAVRSKQKLENFRDRKNRTVNAKHWRVSVHSSVGSLKCLAWCAGARLFRLLAATNQGDMTTEFVKCKCQHCNNGIEFNPSDAGKMAECPHCQIETLLFIPYKINKSDVSPAKIFKKSPFESNWACWVYGGIGFIIIEVFSAVATGSQTSIAYDILMSVFSYIGISFVICLYFLPYYFAKQNNKKNKQAIFLLNLFLGWTLIGWVVAIVWAHIKD